MSEAISTLPRPRRRSQSASSERRQPQSLAFLWTLLLVSALLFVVAGYQFWHAERIYQGVRVLGVSLGGLSPAAAEQVLQEQFTPYPMTPLTVYYKDQTWPLGPEAVGLRLSARNTVREAYTLGRDSSLIVDLRAQLIALLAGHEVEPKISYDPRQIAHTAERLAAMTQQPAQEASLRVQGVNVSVTPGREGVAVDVGATATAIMNALQANQSSVELVAHTINPQVTDARQAQEAIQRLLRQPLLATYPEGELLQFALDPAALAELMVVSPHFLEDGSARVETTLDRARLTPIVEGWAEQIARPPRDARLDFNPSTSELIVLSPSQEGRSLDVDATVDALLEAVARGERQAPLVVNMTAPDVDMNNLEALGIRELISEGTTRFAGSSRARVHNIRLSAERFNGVVIPPDGIFSFNEHVGEITAANGYEDSLIIWGDRTAVGIGGGVCQTSTTVFRAAFFGGFPMVERWNHGYIVSWYGEPGLDATIYTPTVDFKFRNDTGYHLLIKTHVDEARGELAFRFYGTKPDRRVVISDPVIENVVEPGPPIYQEDPSLAAGQSRQVEWAKRGMKVTYTRTVFEGDQVVDRYNLVSNYQPWRSIYLVGPTVESAPAESEPSGAESEG